MSKQFRKQNTIPVFNNKRQKLVKFRPVLQKCNKNSMMGPKSPFHIHLILTVQLLIFFQKCDILSPLPPKVVNKYKVCIDKGTYDAISLSKVLTIVTSVMEFQVLVKYYVWFLKQEDWKTFQFYLNIQGVSYWNEWN